MKTLIALIVLIVITPIALGQNTSDGGLVPAAGAVAAVAPGPEPVPAAGLRRVQLERPQGYKLWDRDDQALSALATTAWYEVLKSRNDHRDRTEAGTMQADEKWGITLPLEDANALAQEIDKLVAAQSVPADQRLVKLEENRKQIEQLGREKDVLLSLRHGEEKLSEQLMAEKIKQMELERQRIDMELFAKQSRRKALADQIKNSREELKGKVQGDAVYEQLVKIIELRAAALERVKQMQKSNVASSGEVNKAEEDLAEAKIRAAERSEAIAQTGDVDIIRKLTSDLALLMVDVSELEARKAYIAQQFPESESITSSQLKSMTEATKHAYKPGGQLPPLFYELTKQENDLLLERGALLAGKVTVVAVQADANGPGTR